MGKDMTCGAVTRNFACHHAGPVTSNQAVSEGRCAGGSQRVRCSVLQCLDVYVERFSWIHEEGLLTRSQRRTFQHTHWYEMVRTSFHLYCIIVDLWARR